MYAQIRKSDNIVSLIGGKEVGLPIEHPDVLCIDIGENKEGIKTNWTYHPDTKTFEYIPLIAEKSPKDESGAEENIIENKLTKLSESVVELREEQKKDNLLILRTVLEAVEEITTPQGGTE